LSLESPAVIMGIDIGPDFPFKPTPAAVPSSFKVEKPEYHPGVKITSVKYYVPSLLPLTDVSSSSF
jgi:hypothetical protein